MKFGRNLTACEILDQALHFRRIEPVDHLVFMGMGEPMMNLDNVLDGVRAAARHRHHPPPHDDLDGRLGPGDRRGWPRADMPMRLALSLHAPEDALRSRDHAGQRPLPDRRRARRVRRAGTSGASAGMVFIEYVMLAGVNDRYAQAVAARRAARPAASTRST